MSKRKSTLGLIFLAVISCKSFAQISNNPSSTKETPIYIDGFDYPNFDSVSNFAWFKTHFPLGSITELNIGGEHYRTYFADRFLISFEAKQYLDKKASLIGGYQLEFDLLNEGKGNPNTTPRREVYMGLGYDVKPNWFLEAKLVTPLGDPEFDKIGLEGVGTRLEVGTKLKF